MKKHALSGRKQSPEHIRRRVEAVAKKRAAWTDEQKAAFSQKIREANERRDPERQRKFIYSNVGREPWCKGKKIPQISGKNHWNYGNNMPQESIEKMRQSLTGKKQSPELIAKRVAGRKGYTHSEETRRKISETNRARFATGARERLSGERSPSWNGGLKEVSCSFCGRTAHRTPSQMRKSEKYFCDKTCHGKWISKNWVEENHPMYGRTGLQGERNPMWKGGQITTHCSNPVCNKVIQRDAHRVFRSKQFFCSPKCRAVVQNQGERSPRWRGGLSFEPYPVAWNFRLREMIRERDGRTCQVCGEKENGTRLACHHIDYDKANIVPQNLVALCHGCHVKTNSHRAEWIKFFSAGVVATA